MICSDNFLTRNVCEGLNGLVRSMYYQYARDGRLGDKIREMANRLLDERLPPISRQDYSKQVIAQAGKNFSYVLQAPHVTDMFSLLHGLGAIQGNQCVVLREPTMFAYAAKTFGVERTLFITDDKYVADWYTKQVKNGKPIFQRANGDSIVLYMPFDDDFSDQLLTRLELFGMRKAKALADFIVSGDGECSQSNSSKIIFVGNPQYQQEQGRSSAIPIYQNFVRHALTYGDEVLFVIPARWYAGGKGKDLEEFRVEMLAGRKAKQIIDFPRSDVVFSNVDIEGGVCFLHATNDINQTLYFTTTNGQKHEINAAKFDILVRDPKAYSIIEKVLAGDVLTSFMNDYVVSQTPFGLLTSFSDFVSKGPTTVPCLTKGGIKDVELANITRGHDLIPRWKVVASEAFGLGDRPDAMGRRKVIGKLEVLPPNHVCLQTYLVLSAFDTEDEANNCLGYLRLKFPRFLLAQRKISQHISPSSFKWVPKVDFGYSHTDSELYEKFGLTSDEIDHIEATIRCIP